MGSEMCIRDSSWASLGITWSSLELTWDSLGSLLNSLGTLLGLSWGSLQLSWASLGITWASVGITWATVGITWGSLGLTWDSLGSLLRPLGALLGSLGALLGSLGPLLGENKHRVETRASSWASLGRKYAPRRDESVLFLKIRTASRREPPANSAVARGGGRPDPPGTHLGTLLIALLEPYLYQPLGKHLCIVCRAVLCTRGSMQGVPLLAKPSS